MRVPFSTPREEAPAPALPSVTLCQHPVYIAAELRFRQIEADVRAATEEIDDVNAEFSARYQTGVQAQAAETAAYAAGNWDPDGASNRPLQERLDVAHRRLTVARRALELARLRLGDARNEASREIAEKLRPEYGAIVERLAAAVVEAGRLADAERTFREAMLSDGVRFQCSFPVLALHDLCLALPATRANRFLDDVARAGFSFQDDPRRRSELPGRS